MNLGFFIFLGSLGGLTFIRIALPKRSLNRRKSRLRDHPLQKDPKLSQRLRNKAPVHIAGNRDQALDSRTVAELVAQDRPPSEMTADTPTSTRFPKKTVRLYISVTVSLIVLASSLFVILNGSYDDATEKWAFGAVGTILGYWLKD